MKSSGDVIIERRCIHLEERGNLKAKIGILRGIFSIYLGKNLVSSSCYI